MDGLPLTIYMDDADQDGNPDEIMVDGVARYSHADKCWVAEVNWDESYHASEASERIESNGMPGDRPARTA